MFRLKQAIRLVWKAAPGWTIANSILNFIQGFIPVIALLILKHVVDSVTLAISDTGTPEDVQRAIFFVILIGVVTAIGALLENLMAVTLEAQGQLLTDYVQALIHDKSLVLDLAYFETPKYYDNLHNAQRQGPIRPTQIITKISGLFRNLISFFGIVGLLFLFSPLMVFIIVCAAFPGLLVKMKFSGILFRWIHKRTESERLAVLYNWIITDLRFAKEVRLYHLGDYIKQQYAEIRKKLRTERIDLAKKRAIASFASQFISIFATMGMLIYIILAVIKKMITLGDLVMYYTALQRSVTYLQQILLALAGLYEDNLFLSYLQEFIEQDPEISDPQHPHPMKKLEKGGIFLDGISFAYPSQKNNIINNLTLEIKPQQIVAIVGENGAGKTTLAKLLCRLYDPGEGRITFEGEDLRSFKLDELRRQIAVVFQDYVQYPVTIQENIAFGDITKFQRGTPVADAARWSGIHQYIEHLPKKYDTRLGKWFAEGEELSIGQWQKLALARAYYRDAQFLILDEPTSALDALAEKEILDKIRELLRNKTALLISHRFSSVRMADYIYVMHNGSVLESGTHKQLMELNEKYAKMYKAQVEYLT